MPAHPKLTLLTLLLAIAAPAQQPATLRQLYDGTMLPGVAVATFAHSDTLLPVDKALRKGPMHPIPQAANKLTNVNFRIGAKDYDLFDYLTLNRVAGLLILKDGKVAFEDYELGIQPDTRWASFSMAKAMASTLVGAALQQGLIASIDDPLTRYVPALKGGVYEGVTVRNVLMMASGVKWSETYTDPHSDRRLLLEDQLAGKPDAVLHFMNALPRAAAPGSIWNYNTGETYLVGALIEGATHKSASAFLSETIWSRLGMEQDATWWVERPKDKAAGGMTLAGSGLAATLRDYGRFGLMVLNGGIIDGKRIVPEGWFEEATKPHLIGGKHIDYGYLWWPTPTGDPIHEGSFEAHGIFGQHLYINPKEKLVIVVLSAHPKPSSGTVVPDYAFFAAVAKQLHQ